MRAFLLAAGLIGLALLIHRIGEAASERADHARTWPRVAALTCVAGALWLIGTGLEHLGTDGVPSVVRDSYDQQVDQQQLEQMRPYNDAANDAIREYRGDPYP